MYHRETQDYIFGLWFLVEEFYNGQTLHVFPFSSLKLNLRYAIFKDHLWIGACEFPQEFVNIYLKKKLSVSSYFLLNSRRGVVELSSNSFAYVILDNNVAKCSIFPCCFIIIKIYKIKTVFNLLEATTTLVTFSSWALVIVTTLKIKSWWSWALHWWYPLTNKIYSTSHQLDHITLSENSFCSVNYTAVTWSN